MFINVEANDHKESVDIYLDLTGWSDVNSCEDGDVCQDEMFETPRDVFPSGQEKKKAETAAHILSSRRQHGPLEKTLSPELN